MAIETIPMHRFKNFYDFSLRSSSICLGENCWFAHFKVDADVIHLFPYFHVVGDDVFHYADPEVLQFKMGDFFVALYPPDIVRVAKASGNYRSILIWPALPFPCEKGFLPKH